MFYRRHTVERPYECEYCDYAAVRKASFEDHMERHHPFDMDELNMQLYDIHQHIRLAQEQDSEDENGVVTSQPSAVIDTKAIPVNLSVKPVYGAGITAVNYSLSASCCCIYCGHQRMASQLNSRTPNTWCESRTSMVSLAGTRKRAWSYPPITCEEPPAKRAKRSVKSEKSEVTMKDAKGKWYLAGNTRSTYCHDLNIIYSYI